MKFKIIEIKQRGNQIYVAISHTECVRQVFNFHIDMYKDKKYIEEIKKILTEIYGNKKKINIDKSDVGKEFDV